jgi:pyruvate,orthophosphate dikinase
VTETATPAATAAQYIHTFESPLQDKLFLGGKGASLARMTGLMGLPVPPGFTITTEAFKAFAQTEPVVPAPLAEAVQTHLVELAGKLGRRIDDPGKPLLLSVRSGAPVSMPGMMDTVLNVGMNDEVVKGLAARTSDRFALQSYGRLLATFAEVVRELPAEVLSRAHHEADAASDADRVRIWKDAIESHGDPFPQTTHEQVLESIGAVWRSWNRPRALRYRKYRGIPEDLGTAVTVQAMVFGNLDQESGTGVVFTRDPGTGAPTAYGDFMRCAQGEDVVNGSQIPESIESLREQSQDLWESLVTALRTLEHDTRDMCDVEFTVQHGRLWILQSRVGQRSPAAAVRVAVDMVEEGLIDVDTALDRVSLAALEHLQAPACHSFDGLVQLGQGVPASPGTGVGPAVLDPSRAEAMADEGTAPVLLCPTTSPQDINGMIVAAGIVTALGGRASHAAVVARGMGKPAACGIEGMVIDADARTVTFPSGEVIREGDTITVSGDLGVVLRGSAQFSDPEPDEWLQRLLSWCDARAGVPILVTRPDEAHVVAEPEDFAEGMERVVIDVPWEGAESVALLDRVCRTVFESPRPPAEVYVAMPESLAGIDFRPSYGPWSGIIAHGDNTWAARLLSGRLTVAALAR